MNSLKTHFEDSKLSDAHGPNVAINALVNNELDCIIGYAFVYALAPVARMSPYWRDKDSVGIPVITSVGLTSNLDNRNEYKLMTRISSPYKVVKDAVLALFKGMEWRMAAYVFHDQKHDTTNPSLPYGECYLLMASLQPHLYKYNRMEHNYYIFNELNFNHERMRENLRKASLHANVEPPNNELQGTQLCGTLLGGSLMAGSKLLDYTIRTLMGGSIPEIKVLFNSITFK